MSMPEQYVTIPGDPHWASIAFGPAQQGDRYNGIVHASVRIAPSFVPGSPDTSDILSKHPCLLEHFATAGGVTALRARSEASGVAYKTQYEQIVHSVGALVSELNDIANGTGEWGPSA